MAEVRHPYRVLTALIMASILIPLNSTMIATELDPIAQSLSTSLSSVVWIVTTYLIIMAAVQPISGKLGDLYGSKRLLNLGLWLFLLFSVIGALIPDFPALIAARLGQALGGALVIPNAIAMARHSFHEDSLRHNLGLIGMAQGLGAATGPFLGSLLIQLGGWPAMFWVNVPMIGSALVASALVLPKDLLRKKAPPIDVFGALSLAGFLALFALSMPETSLAMGRLRLLWAVIALILLMSFIRVEHHVLAPIVYLPFFRQPAFRYANLANLVNNFFMYSTLLYVPIVLRNLNFAMPAIGGLLFFFSLVMSWTSWLGSRLSVIRDRRFLIMTSFLLDFIVTGWYELLPSHHHWAFLIIGLLIAGMGAGIGNVAMQTIVLESVDLKAAGSASGIYATFRYIGSILAASLLEIMVQKPAVHLIVLLATLGFGLMISWALLKSRVDPSSSLSP
ncbi:Predicted arabinose efflux permease, MFS family [Sulfobacillus thermosulfidooxidans DSM 9293]|uniref:Predicted arabinose efflux permease, MFS family n=1 Tax=Sulfobacillus thermosulfidooxidans (strain DSM 9293 / VKM B-1269 / AT-1) TaxID=929705 RepID=A0A1W1W783_SULTA|nr:MFS transporter [Sulfobacillus thermosulfidooxidans]SMC02125.1 Predicted arabinose efflux permease, MFS family [Sulfobacillus thermosulfidooxidans DSM 9293]